MQSSSSLTDVIREHVVAIAAKGVVTSEPSAIGAEVAASQPDEGRRAST